MARQFGGDDTPDNLFLLCEECHIDSPDTYNKEAFFRWVRRRRNEYCYGINIAKILSEINSELLDRGYDPKRVFFELRSDCTNIVDCAVDGCGSHGGRICDSSLVVAIADIIESRFLKKQNEL